MAKIKIEKVEQVNIKLLKPYWRNARENSKTVEVLKESIKKYGFNVPLNIDKNNVIITGHARFNALKQLGHTGNVPCIVKHSLTEKEVKEYRIADNKIHEMTEWLDKDIILELREIGGENMQQYFPEVNLDNWLNESVGFAAKEVSEEEILAKKDALESMMENSSEAKIIKKILVTCPHCINDFYLDQDETR